MKPLTRDAVAKLIANDHRDGQAIVQLTITRATKPTRNSRVRLRGRSGPYSAIGRTVYWKKGECSAWWHLEDLREAIKPREPTREELEAFLVDVREADALPDPGPAAQAVHQVVHNFDAKLAAWPGDR